MRPASQSKQSGQIATRFANSAVLTGGGNRDANRALHVILVVRMRRHGLTRDYFARRMAEGKTKNEIMRCVKRYIAREIYHVLHEPSRRTNELIA